MAKCEVSLDVDESVRFHPIDAQVARGQDVTVRYTVGERFRPKSGDWIGLFSVNGSGRTDHEYIGFCWARKYSGWNEGPLERTVDFRISDFKIPDLEKEIYYKFVYVTSSEKLIGCSNEFQILLHVPVTVCKKSEPSSEQNETTRTCHNAVVPYELFHRPPTLLHLENLEIHPCFEDLATLIHKADATKCPTVSCFMPTPGFKDWARMTVYIPQPYKRNCGNCRIAKDVITSLHKRLDAKKQEESNTSCYSQRECEDLKAQVGQLKKQKMALESALFKERLAKWTLVHKYAQIKEELMTNIAQMASFLLETQPSSIKQVTRHNWLDQGSNSEPKKNEQSQVTINQNKGIVVNAALNTDNKSLTKPSVKQLPYANRHENHNEDIMRNVELFGKTSDTEVKKAFNHSKDVRHHETYSGSRIGFNRLFKEPIVQYSGSNITFGRLFDERSHRQTQQNTYSGSNLALSLLFDEEHREDIRNRVDEAERNGYASCCCHCPVEIDSNIDRKDLIGFRKLNEMAKDVLETSAVDKNKTTSEYSILHDSSKNHSSDDHKPTLCSKDNPSEAEKKQDTGMQKTITDRLPNISLISKEILSKPIKKTSKTLGKATKRSDKVSSKIKVPTKHSEISSARKMDAAVQVDGFLYHGAVYWMSADSNSQAKPCAFFPLCQQTNDEVIPPAKSLTVSGIAQTGGKLEALKQPMVAKVQAEISRDAKSASSLGRPVPKTQGNELAINSTPAITTNRKLKMNNDVENVAADSLTSKKQDLTSHTTSVQTIQTIDSNNISSLINDTRVISIPHAGNNNTAFPAPNTKGFLAPQKIDEPKVITSGEQNKKRKKSSKVDSFTSGMTKSTDLEHLKISAHQNTIITDQLPHEKSSNTPTKLDDSATKRASIKQQCAMPTSSSQVGAGRVAQSIRNDNKISLSESAHSTGTGIIPNIFVQIKNGLPLLSCPFLPRNSETLQTETRANEDNEYPPLPSTPTNNRETRSHQDQAVASYAFITKQDPQSANQQEPKRAFHNLAKLAKKILHKYCGSEDELETPKRQDTFICSGGKCQNPHVQQPQVNISKEPPTNAVPETPENHTINTSTMQATSQNTDYISTIKLFNAEKNSQNMDQVLVTTRGSYKSANGKSRTQETVTNAAATDLCLQQTQASNKTQSNNTTIGRTEQDENVTWNVYWKTTKKMKKKTEGTKH